MQRQQRCHDGLTFDARCATVKRRWKFEHEGCMNDETDSFRGAVDYIFTRVPSGQRMADIGCGNGDLSRQIAKASNASFLHLVDDTEFPEVGIPCCQERVWKFSVELEPWLPWLRGQIDTIVCVKTVHEFEQPAQTVAKILSLFPRDGNGLIFIADYAEGFWSADRAATLADGLRLHYEDDLRRVRRTGLYRNDDIRAFWRKAFADAGLEDPDITFPPNNIGYLFAHTGNGPLWDEQIPMPAGPPF